jgi:ribulose-phosphate 3-epimerase
MKMNRVRAPMSDFRILPSILSANHGKFIEEAKTVDIPEIEFLHVDVMDGHFVPNITFGPKVVESLKKHTRFKLDVHLMIENVDEYIPRFADAGADIITIHQEAARHLDRSLNLIRQSGAKVGVTINPATPLETLENILSIVDLVLIMSVNPGFGGQSFIESSIEKIRKLAEMRKKGNHNFIIEVDGGIDHQTAPLTYGAGAEYFVAGNAIFGQSDRPAAVLKIIQSIETYRQKQKSVIT